MTYLLKYAIIIIVSMPVLEAQEIYLMRHGEYSGDSLTEKGRNQVVKAVANIGKMVSAVYYSSKTRTKETAEIIARETGCKNVKEIDWLNDDNRFNKDAFLAIKDDVVVYVSHGPTLVEMAMALGNETKSWGYAHVVKVVR